MATYHRVEIDGHMLDFDHVPSSTEVKEIQAKLAPPTSQVPEGHPYLAAAARVATPIAGGFLGAASPIPGGTAIGAAAGGALGETIAEKLEGRKQVNPREVGAQAVISGVLPGPGSTLAKGVLKSAAHGLGSVTLDSLARTGEFPDVGQAALGLAIGGATGGLVTKLHLRSSLREVLPTDVADATHEILTKGKVIEPPEVAKVFQEDLAEVKATQKAVLRDSKGRFVPEKVFYHGTSKNFGRFDPNKSAPDNLYGPGVYFTDNPEVASEYSGFDKKTGQVATGAQVIPARLSVRNPFDVDSHIPPDKLVAIREALRDEFKVHPWKSVRGLESRLNSLDEYLADSRIGGGGEGKRVYEVIQNEVKAPQEVITRALKRVGYDGITHTGGGIMGDVPHKVTIAFDPEQIYPTLGNIKSNKPTVRVRLGSDPGKYEFSTVKPPVLSEKTGEKFKWKKVGKGEYVKEPIDAPPSVGGEDAPEPVHKPEGQIGISRIFTPQIWLFDRIQSSTKIPVYDEVYRPIREAVEAGDKKAIRSTINTIKTNYLSKSSPLPDDARRSVQHLVNMAQGVHDGVMQDLAVSIKRMANRIPGVGRYVDEKTAREFAANVATLQYQGTLPGRVGPLLRNTAQTLQTGYMTLGEQYYWKGVKQGLSKEGFKKATSLGFLGPEHTIAAELEHSNSWYSRMIRAGFYPYQKIDDFNNAVMGLGQYERTLAAARQARGNVAEFVDRANLDLAFPKAERDGIAALYASGNVQEAAKRAGLIRANTTQFLYGPAERPEVLTSTTIGRVGGGFGNWPAFYGNLLKELATGDASKTKKAIAFSRLAVAHGVLGVGAYGIYKGYGYDAKKARARAIDMVGFGPLFYGGGAALESFKTAEEAVRKGVEGQQSIGQSAKELGRAARPLIPFGYAYNDYFGSTPIGKYPDASKEGYVTRLRKTLEDR